MESEITPGWLLVLLPLLPFVAFPLMWCGVLWINSQIGGWSRLAKRYRSSEEPNGKTFHSVQGQVRGLWASLGWERSPLGSPTADERATA